MGFGALRLMGRRRLRPIHFQLKMSPEASSYTLVSVPQLVIKKFDGKCIQIYLILKNFKMSITYQIK